MIVRLYNKMPKKAMVLLLLLISFSAAAVETQKCAGGFVQYGEYKRTSACNEGSIELKTKLKFFCSWREWVCKEYTCGKCHPAMDLDSETGRPYKQLVLEQERRDHASGELIFEDVPDGFDNEVNENEFLSGDLSGSLMNISQAGRLSDFFDSIKSHVHFQVAFFSALASNALFPLTNFVDGFRDGDSEDDKWNKPVPGERVGIVSYDEYARSVGASFTVEHEYFKQYFTGARVPSWEDNKSHDSAVKLLDSGVKSLRRTGIEPIEILYGTESRFAFDNEGLIKATWNGFKFMGPREIKYASNGVHGIAVIERYDSEDSLGILVTDSVFSIHLVYDQSTDTYGIDLSKLEKYTPIEGYSKMGGKATFKLIDGRLQTTRLEYFGNEYTSVDFQDPDVRQAYQENRLVGWRFAEKAIIASLLSLTNLVIHVKDLHLELAAAFQAVAVDSFADSIDNPVSRLLQPFIHRSIQATNDNFKLLFEYKASEFSLAPLPNSEQMRLIGDFIETEPLKLSDLDMVNFARNRHMPSEAVGKDGFWRWHYRASKVQDLYESMIGCFLDHNYPTEENLVADKAIRLWWANLFKFMPAISRMEDSPWASRELSRAGIKNVLKTMFTWLSWVHEDVGHSAASLVYNPVYTPMGVPTDGKGVPFNMFVFNSAAYRGFVFLNRAKLLDVAPDYWFSEGGEELCPGDNGKCSQGSDRHCFEAFQFSLQDLGVTDSAFSECGKNGFYSCVDFVETGVSS